MFTTLGLFGSSQCPAGVECSRFHCSFAHRKASASTLSASGVKRAAVTTSGIEKSAKVARSSVGGSATVPSSTKRTETVRPVAKALVSNSSSYVGRSGGNGKATLAAPTGPPKLVIDIKNSKQPRPDREKALGKLFQQYTKLYALILPQSPSLAHESALAQELETSSTTSSRLAYNSAIHHALVNIHKRVVPTSLDHPSVGTVKESKALMDAAEKAAAGRLSRDRIKRYLMTDWEKWRYPDPTGNSLDRSEAGCEPNLEGHVQTCSRCKLDYTVTADVSDRFGECLFHHGRLAPERVEGQRKWMFSCCGKERGREGCEEGVHVFSESDDDVLLNRREGYLTVAEVAEQLKAKGKGSAGWLDVVGIDCEMIHTTAGISLGRVTVLDESGAIVLDELVRQTNAIIDLNQRFSGIQPGQLEGAAMDLKAVREAVCYFIGPETIIIGHGLENDLRAMRLLHDKVIDTVEVFPHDKGPPFRRALRDLVKEKLGYFIQSRTADLGHDSAADARATLELMACKVTRDGQAGRIHS